MSIDLDDFKPLAGVLFAQGAPLLARALLGPFGGMVADAVVPALAGVFGLPTTAPPAEIAKAVKDDPDAATKVAAVQDQHAELIDWAKQATDANQAALALEPSFWGRLYVGGWRPFIGWSGGLTIVYQTLASVQGLPLVPVEHFLLITGLVGSLAGIRGWEKAQGVASTALTTVAKVAAKRPAR